MLYSIPVMLQLAKVNLLGNRHEHHHIHVVYSSDFAADNNIQVRTNQSNGRYSDPMLHRSAQQDSDAAHHSHSTFLTHTDAHLNVYRLMGYQNVKKNNNRYSLDVVLRFVLDKNVKVHHT